MFLFSYEEKAFSLFLCSGGAFLGALRAGGLRRGREVFAVGRLDPDEGRDFAFEGEITNYTSTTAAVTSGTSNDYASLNRLTITVKVRFTNAVDEKMSFNKSFSAYADYSAEQLLTEAEGTLIPEIVDQLVTDIFQAAASNW